MSASISRRALPGEYRNVSLWPDIEEALLDGQENKDEARLRRARILRAAIKAYFAGDKVQAVCRDCGIQAGSLYHALHRCTQIAPDGQIYGFRALLPTLSKQAYRRSAKLPSTCDPKAGMAGAFGLFLARHNAVKQGLDCYIDKKDPSFYPDQARFSYKSAYSEFCTLCKQSGVTGHDYPFLTNDHGRRAVSRYIKRTLDQSFARQARARGGERAATMARTGTGHPRLQLNLSPFDLVSLDAKRIDAIGTVEIKTSRGPEFIPIHRVQFIPCIENGCGAVLGYRVAIRKEATAHDVMLAIQHSLRPWTPRTLSVRGLEYPFDAMLPSALPNAAGLTWATTLIDNASIHYSLAMTERLPRVLGCSVSWGPVSAWYHNPVSEAVFSALDRMGFHRLPNTTGTGPHDALRADAVQAAVDLRITWTELLDLIDLAVCQYNATQTDALGGRSRIESIRDALNRDDWLPRRLPSTSSIDDLDTVHECVRVLGNVQKGRRPYVNLWNARYTSPVLADSPHLIGKELVVFARESDPRTLRAYLPDHRELGFLTAMGPWGITLHSRGLRAEIIRAHKRGELPVSLNDPDIFSAYMHIKQTNALKQKAAQKDKRPKISEDATALARTMEITGEQPPVAIAPSSSPAPVRSLAPTLPSFIPTLVHRSMSK